jgi:drug/metabolite transporter (DMT)-like permease
VVVGVLFLNLDFDSFSIKLNRGVLFILASTFCWALDNNFTSKISSKDSCFYSNVLKGLVEEF